jgi:hypothetical protein
MVLPLLEVLAGRDHEAGVVQAVRRLVEEIAVVRVVAVQHDHEVHRVVGEELADAAGMRDVHPELDAEHTLVPGHAGVDVADGQGEVVQSCGRGHERAPLVVRFRAGFAGARWAWQ